MPIEGKAPKSTGYPQDSGRSRLNELLHRYQADWVGLYLPLGRGPVFQVALSVQNRKFRQGAELALLDTSHLFPAKESGVPVWVVPDASRLPEAIRGYHLSACPVKRRKTNQGWLVMLRRQRAAAEPLPDAPELSTELRDLCEGLAAESAERAAHRWGPVLLEARQVYYETLSASESALRILRGFAVGANALNARLLVEYPGQDVRSVFALWDDESGLNSEQINQRFRELSIGPIGAVYTRGDSTDKRFANTREVFVRVELESSRINLLLLLPTRGGRRHYLFSDAEWLYSRFSSFLAEVSPLEVRLQAYNQQRELSRAIQEILELRDMAEFREAVPELIRQYLRVDYLGLYEVDWTNRVLQRLGMAGKTTGVRGDRRKPIDAGTFIGHCATSGRSILQPVVNQADRHRIPDHPEWQSLMFYPHGSDGQVILVLEAATRKSGSISFRHIQAIENLEPYLMMAFRNSRRHGQLVQELFHDTETGLFNRRGFEAVVERHLALSKKRGDSFAVMMIGVDRPDRLEGAQSSSGRRRMLAQVAENIRQCLADDCQMAYGGNYMFFVLLPRTDLDGALKYARQLCRHSEKIQLADMVHPTYSAGVASFPINGMGMEELVQSAEQAMTLSRFLGGNTASIIGSHNIKELALHILSGILGAETFETGPDLVDGVLKKITNGVRKGELTVLEVIDSLAEAIDAKDHYTGNHTLETSIYAVALARRMGLNERSLERLRNAAKLHDIGKIGVPEHILCKEGKLTSGEADVMRKHPETGARILRHIGSLKDIADIVEHHHERWDGSGYPHGLEGEEIPMESRILAVIDAYHAMTSNRSYRRSCVAGDALAEIRASAGTQFDPLVADRFIELMAERGLHPSGDDSVTAEIVGVPS